MGACLEYISDYPNAKDGELVDEVVNLQRLQWLDNVLRMPDHCLPNYMVASRK